MSVGGLAVMIYNDMRKTENIVYNWVGRIVEPASILGQVRLILRSVNCQFLARN
jgi:hypothetical protein